MPRSELCRAIPPNTLKLSGHSASPAFSLAQERINFLKVRLTLLTHMESGKYKGIHLCCIAPPSTPARVTCLQCAAVWPGAAGILELSKQICAHLTASADSFDAATLEKLVRAVLPLDHLRAIEFSLRIGKVVRRSAHSFALLV